MTRIIESMLRGVGGRFALGLQCHEQPILDDALRRIAAGAERVTIQTFRWDSRANDWEPDQRFTLVAHRRTVEGFSLEAICPETGEDERALIGAMREEQPMEIIEP